MSQTLRRFNASSMGQRLRAVRVARGYRFMSDFYVDLGVSNSNMSRYEAGQAIPPIERLVEIASKLNCPIEYLLQGVDDRMPTELRRKLDEIGAGED